MQGGDYDQGFHEIGRISREIRMKSGGFHEIRRISCGFHEIRRISCVKSKDLLQGIVTLCFNESR